MESIRRGLFLVGIGFAVACTPFLGPIQDGGSDGTLGATGATGCDGFGMCLPAPAGTTCGDDICQNGSASAGQWATAIKFGRLCDGIAAAATSCKDTVHRQCDGNLTCTADGSSCRSACVRD